MLTGTAGLSILKSFHGKFRLLEMVITQNHNLSRMTAIK